MNIQLKGGEGRGCRVDGHLNPIQSKWWGDACARCWARGCGAPGHQHSLTCCRHVPNKLLVSPPVVRHRVSAWPLRPLGSRRRRMEGACVCDCIFVH